MALATSLNPSFYFNTDKVSGIVTDSMPLYKTLDEAKKVRSKFESVYYAFFDTTADKYRTFQIVKPFSFTCV